MSETFQRVHSKGCRGLSLALIGLVLATRIPGKQLPSAAKAQISQQAALFATQPIKVSLKIITLELIVGSPSKAEISILNADNEVLPTKEDWPCVVTIHFASGKSSSQTVWIRKGQSSSQFDFLPEEKGWTSVQVQPPSNGVRSDKAEFIVRPAKKPHAVKPVPHGVSSSSPLPERPQLLTKRTDGVTVRFRLASFGSSRNAAEPAQVTDARPGPSAPVLHISLNDPSGIYRANGKDAAVISATFESPDFSPAPIDIHIWFHWTNGVLDPRQPL